MGSGPAEFLHLAPAYLSAYQKWARPDRVVTVPLYAIERGGRLLEPRGCWLLVSLRQQAWQAAQAKEAGDGWFRVSATTVAEFVGLSRATFWRYVGGRPWFAWLLQKEKGPARLVNGEYESDANRYRFAAEVPFTPADQAHLGATLARLATGSDADAAIAAIEGALRLGRDALLAPDPGAPAPQEAGPLSVLQIVRRCFPLAAFSRQQLKTAAELADRLYALVVQPHRLLLISHYFIQHWLPKLGHAAGLTACYLANRGMLDPQHGIERDLTQIEGGVQALAALLGRSVALNFLPPLPGAPLPKRAPAKAERYLSTKADVELVRSLFRLFAEPVKVSRTGRRYDILFRVALRVPLVPEHRAGWLADAERELEESAGLAPDPPSHSPSSEMNAQAGQLGVEIETAGNGLGVVFETAVGDMGVEIETGEGGSGVETETPGNGLGVSFETPPSRNCDTLKLLEILTPSYSSSLQPPPPQLAGEEAEVLDRWEAVDFDQLLEQGGVLPSTRRDLREQGLADAALYVAWYLKILSERPDRPAYIAARRILESHGRREACHRTCLAIADQGRLVTAAYLILLRDYTGPEMLETPDWMRPESLRGIDITLAGEFIAVCGSLARGRAAERAHYQELHLAAREALQSLDLDELVPDPLPAMEATGVDGASPGSEAGEREAELSPEDTPLPLESGAAPDGGTDVPIQISAERAWEQACHELKYALGKAGQRSWISMANLLGYEEGKFRVGVPGHDVEAHWRRNQEQTEELLSRITRGPQQLQLVVEGRTRTQPDPSVQDCAGRWTMALSDLWEAAAGQLRLEIPTTTFNTWVQPVSLGACRIVDGCLECVLLTPNRYSRDWLENRLQDALRRTLAPLTGQPVNVRIEVAGTPAKGQSPRLTGAAIH